MSSGASPTPFHIMNSQSHTRIHWRSYVEHMSSQSHVDPELRGRRVGQDKDGKTCLHLAFVIGGLGVNWNQYKDFAEAVVAVSSPLFYPLFVGSLQCLGLDVRATAARVAESSGDVPASCVVGCRRRVRCSQVGGEDLVKIKVGRAACLRARYRVPGTELWRPTDASAMHAVPESLGVPALSNRRHDNRTYNDKSSAFSVYARALRDVRPLTEHARGALRTRKGRAVWSGRRRKDALTCGR